MYSSRGTLVGRWKLESVRGKQCRCVNRERGGEQDLGEWRKRMERRIQKSAHIRKGKEELSYSV